MGCGCHKVRLDCTVFCSCQVRGGGGGGWGRGGLGGGGAIICKIEQTVVKNDENIVSLCEPIFTEYLTDVSDIYACKK